MSENFGVFAVAVKTKTKQKTKKIFRKLIKQHLRFVAFSVLVVAGNNKNITLNHNNNNNNSKCRKTSKSINALNYSR